MDKNQITGIVLISVIVIGFMIWMQPSKEQLAKQKQTKDSIALVEQNKLQPDTNKTVKVEILKPEDTLLDYTKKILNKENLTSSDSIVLDSLNQKLYDLYGDFAKSSIGSEKFYTLENDLVKIKILNKGGRIYSVELKNFKTHEKKPLVLFDGAQNVFKLDFFVANKLIATDNFYFESMSGNSLDASTAAKEFKMRLKAGEDKYIDFIYKLKPGSYVVDYDISFENLGETISKNSNFIDLTWETNVPFLELGNNQESITTLLFYKYFEDDVNKLKESKNDEENLPTKVQWIAYKQQFFSSVLIAKNSFENAKVSQIDNPNDSTLKSMHSKMSVLFKGTRTDTIPMAFYFGPNKYKILNNLEVKANQDLNLEELIPLGSSIFRYVNVYIIIPMFNFLGNYISSFGLVILILTFVIKLALFPLTFKSFQASAKMRVLKPQIDEINSKIPADKAVERQQATMALYKKVGVNPMGGCIPVLLQFPILLAMYSFFPASIELRQQSFLWAKDLSSYDSIISWSGNIPILTSLYGNHVSLFTLLMAVAILISTLMNGSQLQNNNSPQMAGMKYMMYLMPIMMIFWFNNYSAGLSYYYLLSNLITIVQTLVMRKFINEEALLEKLNANAKKAKEPQKSKFQQRLEDIAKQKGMNTPKR